MISTMRDKQKLGIYSIELFMVDSQRTVVVLLLLYLTVIAQNPGWGRWGGGAENVFSQMIQFDKRG